MKPKEVIRVLEKLGFEFYRQKGSHRIYVKGEAQITVPFHNKDLKTGTLHNIAKATGLTIEDFRKR